MCLVSYNEAKENFLAGNYLAAEDFFAKNDYALELGYCKLLRGDFGWAKSIFETVSSKDTRADWAGKLIQFIEGKVVSMPSFFQVRNFLEIDLNLLIQAGQAQFVEDIINSSDIFYSINQESYKFIARVMYYNDYKQIALYYLQKAKNHFYCDPEMHLMLANCYLYSGEKARAYQSINNCLEILPNYLPAKRLKATLEKSLNSN